MVRNSYLVIADGRPSIIYSYVKAALCTINYSPSRRQILEELTLQLGIIVHQVQVDSQSFQVLVAIVPISRVDWITAESTTPIIKKSMHIINNLDIGSYAVA